MKKRVVSLLMICALSVGMLAGCGSSETQNQATGSADNTDSRNRDGGRDQDPGGSRRRKSYCNSADHQTGRRNDHGGTGTEGH